MKKANCFKVYFKGLAIARDGESGEGVSHVCVVARDAEAALRLCQEAYPESSVEMVLAAPALVEE